MKTTNKKIKLDGNRLLSYLALVFLGAFAYQGIISLVSARVFIQSLLATITVLLLIKTVLNK